MNFSQIHLAVYDIDSNEYSATFDTRPFDQGVSRYCFSGILNGTGSFNDNHCVLKLYKHLYASDLYLNNVDLRKANVASIYANEFNSESHYRNISNMNIDFKIPFFGKIDTIFKQYLMSFTHFEKDLSFGANDCITVEHYLYGYFDKFNSNNGWANELFKIPQAYSHYTYIKSNKTLVVCDLEGVRDGNTYTLTDPAIHSIDKSYGKTDMGVDGIHSFFYTHKCNTFCKHLEKPKLSLIQSPLENRRNTTYELNLTETKISPENTISETDDDIRV